MVKFDVFVGRRPELSLIDEWANRWNVGHLIAIQGDGGIGKTTLLRQVQRRYQDRDEFAVVYWDYAEHHRTGLPQIAMLYRQLGFEHARFFDALDELERYAYEWMPDQVERHESELYDLAAQELGAFLGHRRLIYLADTTEAIVTSTESVDRLLSRLPNTLAVLAGRNIKSSKLPELKSIFGADNLTLLELDSFDRVESDEFFKAVDPEGEIDADLRAKLHFLTDGRPILLILAVEWLSRDMPLPEMVERSASELRKLAADELADLRERFEFELVDRVRRLGDLLDRAVLYMAQVSRRNDAGTLAVLLDISPAQAETLVQSLSRLPFVKYNAATASCMLHDEMKYLINRHAWAYLDPTFEVRRRLVRRVIENYYEPRIRELSAQVRAELTVSKGPVQRATIGETEWEQWRLEAECLFYRLQLSEQEGLSYFDERFTDALHNNHLIRMRFLLAEMENAGYAGLRDRVDLRRAEVFRLQGRSKEARQLCKRVLNRRGVLPANRLSAHNTLGLIAMNSNPNEAIQEFKAALRIARQEQAARVIGVIHNNLGQVYSRTSELDRALEHFDQAIRCGQSDNDLALVASATNNKAHVYRLRGELAQADAFCRAALAIRQRLGLERGLAYSYLTKGEIDRDRGDLEGAERYTKFALRSFDKLDEVPGRIMAYRSLANIRRHMEQYEETEAYLERALDLAGRIGDESLLADVLNVYGREQRDRAVHLEQAGGDPDEIAAHYVRAERYLMRSLELASRYGDQWLIVRGEFELALVRFLGRLASEDEIARRLDAIWDKAKQLGYVLLQGYIEETRGEIAERRADYATAAQHFGSAACLIAQRSGREPERFFDRLSDRLLNPHLPVGALHTLARGILEIVQGASRSDALRSLQLLCKQTLNLNSFV